MNCTPCPQPPQAESEVLTTRGTAAEWRVLSRAITAAFADNASVSPHHPCADCLRQCQWQRLARELRGQGRWEEGCYTRTPILEGDGFVAMLMCWSPGVSSPVHAHSDAETKVKSNCFMLVIDGQLRETVYEPRSIIGSDAVAADEGESRVHDSGAYTYINDSMGLHKVANASATHRAVSLHVYAPGWKSVQLYDEARRPERVDAGGASIDVDEWGDF